MTEGELARQMGDILKARMEEKGISQAEFARTVGVSAKHVNRVLNGKQGTTLAMWSYWAWVLDMRWDIKLVKRGES